MKNLVIDLWFFHYPFCLEPSQAQLTIWGFKQSLHKQNTIFSSDVYVTKKCHIDTTVPYDTVMSLFKSLSLNDLMVQVANIHLAK